MNNIVSIAEQYIKNNKERLLDLYYEQRDKGSVILFFYQEPQVKLKEEIFLSRQGIKYSRDLPDNAYEEVAEYWMNFPDQLTFISCFWPVKDGVTFNVYSLSIFPEDLILAGQIIKLINPLFHQLAVKQSLSANDLSSNVIRNYQNKKYELIAKKILAEAYITRAASNEMLMALTDAKSPKQKVFMKQYIEDLVNAEKLGQPQAKFLLSSRPDLKKQFEKSIQQTEGCFLATAAYGTSQHPNLDLLRSFRDKKLSKNIFGRNFIKIYYRFSPSLANRIKKINVIRFLLRINIEILCGFLRWLEK